MEAKEDGRAITVKEAEKYLRDIETKDSILNGIKRVQVFKGSDALTYLMSKKGLKASDVSNVMKTLLSNHYIVKVRAENEQYTLDDPSYDFNINHQYIWLVEGSGMYGIALGVGVTFIMLALAMFPIWPHSMKVGSGYMFYLLFGIFVALLVVSVLRLVVFGAVKVTTGQNFWILPNLYEECGILESFVPLWGWEDGKKEKEGEKKEK